MGKTKVLIIAIVVFIFNISSYSQNDEFVEIPFVLDSSQIILDASVKDAPAKMVLSTNYPTSIDFDKYRNSYNTIPHHREYRIGLTKRYIPISTITGFRLAGMKLYNLEMYWDGAGDLAYQPRQNVDGVLGYNFFKNRIIQINYPQNTIRIYEQNPYKSLLKDKQSNSETLAILKLKGSAEMPPKEMFYLTTKDILVNGKKVKTLIDINQPLGFLISTETTKLLKPDNQLKSLKLNTINITDLTLNSIGKFQQHKKFDAILGAKFLQNYIVTIDLNKHVMVVQKP